MGFLCFTFTISTLPPTPCLQSSQEPLLISSFLIPFNLRLLSIDSDCSELSPSQKFSFFQGIRWIREAGRFRESEDSPGGLWFHQSEFEEVPRYQISLLSVQLEDYPFHRWDAVIRFGMIILSWFRGWGIYGLDEGLMNFWRKNGHCGCQTLVTTSICWWSRPGSKSESQCITSPLVFRWAASLRLQLSVHLTR